MAGQTQTERFIDKVKINEFHIYKSYRYQQQMSKIKCYRDATLALQVNLRNWSLSGCGIMMGERLQANQVNLGVGSIQLLHSGGSLSILIL